MSRKDEAADMLLDGHPQPIVAAATGLKLSTIGHIQKRLQQPVGGDPNYRGAGILKCKLCGMSCANHPMQRCAAAAG